MIYKLSSICDIKVGYPFKSKFFNTSGDGVRLVRGMNISKNGFRWRNQTRWWNYLYDELSDYYLRENDVLIAMDGNVETNFAIVHSSDLPLLLVQRVARLRAKSFPQKLIWYIVKSPLFSAYIHSVKTGSTISHISANQIGEYSFELPDDMSRITRAVDILDAIDNQIYNNLVINDNLSQRDYRSSTASSPFKSFGNNASRTRTRRLFSRAFLAISCINGATVISNDSILSFDGKGTLTLKSSCWFKPGCAALAQERV